MNRRSTPLSCADELASHHQRVAASAFDAHCDPAGTLFRGQNIVLSPFDDDGMSGYRASRMFMGAAAVGRHGVMQTDLILAQSERRLLECAGELVLLVDSTKFQAPAGHVVCSLGEVDTVITTIPGC